MNNIVGSETHNGALDLGLAPLLCLNIIVHGRSTPGVGTLHFFTCRMASLPRPESV